MSSPFKDNLIHVGDFFKLKNKYHRIKSIEIKEISKPQENYYNYCLIYRFYCGCTQYGLKSQALKKVKTIDGILILIYLERNPSLVCKSCDKLTGGVK